MTMRPVLLLAIAAALLLGGCSDDGSEPPASAPATSASPSPSDELTPTAAATEADCQVRGFVPGSSIIYTRPGPTVLVASQPFTLAGGGLISPGEVTVGQVRITATVTSGNGPLHPGDERAVLQSMGGPGSAADLAATTLSVPVDRLAGRGAYVAYQSADVANGRFRVKACGAPYNDGTSVEVVAGTYRTLQKMSPTRAVRCDAEPASAVEEAAQSAGCDT